MTRRTYILPLFFLTVLLMSAAAPVENAGNLARLFACRGEADTARRLSCYDSAVAALFNSVSRRDVVVVDKAKIDTARRSLFGLSLPRIDLFETDRKDEVRQVDGVVRGARIAEDGNWSISLVSGATWIQTDGQPIARAPRAGDPVVITRGSLGSFFMRVARQPGIRVRRQN